MFARDAGHLRQFGLNYQARMGADCATRAEARAAIVEYIVVFSSSKRRHSSLGYVCPAEDERN
jgi:hypothetical protein